MSKTIKLWCNKCKSKTDHIIYSEPHEEICVDCAEREDDESDNFTASYHHSQ